MLSEKDTKTLQAAQQATDLCQTTLKELYCAGNVLLSELAYTLLRDMVEINQKLKRLLIITEGKNDK